MRLLLDTHALIWWSTDYNKLPPMLFAALTDASNSVYLSLASIWEMQIKSQLSKLTFTDSLPQTIQEQQEENGLLLLLITEAHISL